MGSIEKTSMAWVYLLLAGLLEVAWAIGLKYTDSWRKLRPSVLTLAAMILDFFLLSLALKKIPIGTAYAVWTGIGAAGTAMLGIALFGESRAFGRVLCVGLIVAGIIGLKLTSSPLNYSPAEDESHQQR
jgi:quaternary ammonium compound-resistance protein SugE